MPLPLAAAAPAIVAFIARSGLAAAIKRYGRKAAMAAGKNRNKVTKAEKEARMGGNVPTKKPKVPGTKTQSGTEMPPTSIDVKAAQAARRKANEAAQVKRGIKKGLTTAPIAGVGAAVTGDTIGQAVGLGAFKGKEANEKRKNAAEVERLRRVGQRGAFRQAGERTAKNADAKVKTAAKEKAKADTNAKFDSARKTIKDAVVTKPEGSKTNPTGARTIAASRKAKGTTFTGKDKKQKANVTVKELKDSGMSLRDYLNKQQGKTRRTEMKKGGAVKKTTKKTNKVRGSGIAVRGVRPAKMR